MPLIEHQPKPLKGDCSILELATGASLFDHDAGGEVRDPYGAVGGVDGWPARSAHTEDLDLKFDLRYVASVCPVEGLGSTQLRKRCEQFLILLRYVLPPLPLELGFGSVGIK